MLLFWTIALADWELVVGLSVFGFSSNGVFAIPFTLSAAAVLTALSGLFPKNRANRIVRWTLLSVLFLLYSVQLVYYEIFDTLMSITLVALGGDAVEAFFPTLLRAIRDSLPRLLLMAVPFALMALHDRNIRSGRQFYLRWTGYALLMAAGLFALGMLPIISTGGSAEPGSIYHNDVSTVDRQSQWFGLLTAERLEIKRLLFGGTTLKTDVIDLTQGIQEPAENIPPEEQETKPRYERSVIDKLDLALLAEKAEDPALKELTEYFAGLSGTSKNEYTGLFKGFNVIEICAESYTPWMVSEELMPALYRLTHEGLVFDNFYTTFPSLTANGEYTLCTGLLPDRNRISLFSSSENYMPFTLGHVLGGEGAETYAYHNNVGTFYNRRNAIANLGYAFKATDSGLELSPGYPKSDLELMEQTVDEYIHNARFAVHYMTFSGHTEYNFESNTMSEKNRARVEGLDCSDELKAFYACQLELEDAIEYLLRRLEEEGVADRTVVILTADHYPYGLKESEFMAMAGAETERDPWWKYRGSFACWTGAIDEPIHIDSYCCTQDILPTMLNLLGAEWDSRLLTGMDALSGGMHAAVLYDGSFLTDAMTYSSVTGRITYRNEESQLPEELSRVLVHSVENSFSVAASVLRTDWYRFAFETLGFKPNTGEPQFSTFTDTVGKWYAEAVEELVLRGVVIGNMSPYFNGEELLTNEQLAAFLARLLVLNTRIKPAEVKVPYTDVSTSGGNVYYGSIAALWKEGLIPDRPDNRFDPEGAATLDMMKDYFALAADYLGILPPNEGFYEGMMALQSAVGEEPITGGNVTRGAAVYLLYAFARYMDSPESDIG